MKTVPQFSMPGTAACKVDSISCAIQIADTVEHQWAERQLTIVLQMKIVDHLILPTGGCLFDLENHAAQRGTLTSAQGPGGSVEASIRANDQPGVGIFPWLCEEIVQHGELACERVRG
jgi:hypothetical protein